MGAEKWKNGKLGNYLCFIRLLFFRAVVYDAVKIAVNSDDPRMRSSNA